MLKKFLLLVLIVAAAPARADLFDSVLAIVSAGAEPAKTLLQPGSPAQPADALPTAPTSPTISKVAYQSVDAIAMARGSSLQLASASALVIDQDKGQLLYAKNTNAIQPIASITKLMTAMVVLDAKLKLDQSIQITYDDVDTLKGTRSRLRVGTVLTRREMLKLALMASENRAAAALGRSYPGGPAAFIDAMNRKAASLGMRNTQFLDSSGLNPGNVSTAQDLAIMVNAGYQYPLIRHFTTSESYEVEMESARSRGRHVEFRNSNSLVRAGSWDIGLSKTGYISEAGRCLVMQATIATRPVIIVLLDSWGKMTRLGDANRIKRWLEGVPTRGFPRNRMG
jgi:serine-type D-Ala-D-Ala endopeptidase (penicillin-binding protein 7)